MSESGLRSTIGNRVYAKSVSGVRIPISPPVNSTPSGVLLRRGSSSGLARIEHRSLYQKRSRERFLLTNSATHLVAQSGTWKGGRAAECGGLENRFTGAPGDEGSNPSSSAIFGSDILPYPGPFLSVYAGAGVVANAIRSTEPLFAAALPPIRHYSALCYGVCFC